MNLFSELKKLNLPVGECVVLGSGILGALGIREIKDIDLLVSPKLFDELKFQGWVSVQKEYQNRPREVLLNGDVEAFKEFWLGEKDIDVLKMISEAQIIEGFPFLPLDKLVEMKKAMARERDLKDIEFIQNYLAKNK